MIRMTNETEKDLNIGIRNLIRELNTDNPDFMSTIGTREPRDLHINGKREIGTDENGKPIYETVYGVGTRGTGIDIAAKDKIEAYFKNSDFNSVIDYWNKTVVDALKKCKQAISHYDKDNLITNKNGDAILKDAANSFHRYSEDVSPWNNFTNQNYLEARSDENLDVLTNSDNLDYTQSYDRKTLNDMLSSDESSDNENQQQIVSDLSVADMNNKKMFKMYVKETTTGYSMTLEYLPKTSVTNDVKTWCYLDEYDYLNENKELATLSNSEKNNLYILRILSDEKAKHVELFFEKQVVLKRKIEIIKNNTEIRIIGDTITEKVDNKEISKQEPDIYYSLLNSKVFTSNGANVADYDGVTWEIRPSNKVGFKTVNNEKIECYGLELSVGRTYKNYSIILAALTNLIMPQYKRRVEVEDLNRNFWVISQNLTILNKFMIGLQDGIGEIFKDIFSEIIGLWDNIYAIWKSIFYLDDKINNFDRELNEIGVATSKVKVKIGYENTFYHEGWDRNQEIIKKLFYFDDDGNPIDKGGNKLEDVLMIKDENYYFKKGDAKFFGIYPLLYKDTIACKYTTNTSSDPITEYAHVVSFPLNSTIHPDRIQELKNNNNNTEYTGNESEVINNIFMDGIGADGLPYNQEYNGERLGEMIRIERKFGNIKAEDVLEKVRSKNFVLLGYYLNGENSAIDSLSTVINPFITLLQYMLDVIQKKKDSILNDTKNTTPDAVEMALLANKDFRFGTSIIDDIKQLPANVLNSYSFLKELEVIESSDGGELFRNFDDLFRNFNESSNSYANADFKIDVLPDNEQLIGYFWRVFYKIYKYIYEALYTDENFDTFIIEQIDKNDIVSFLPFQQYTSDKTDYNLSYDNDPYDTSIVKMYQYELEKFILSNEDLQDNGNSAFCPAYVLFKNMREYFDLESQNRFFYYTQQNSDGTSTTKNYKIVFSNTLLERLGVIPSKNTANNESATESGTTVQENDMTNIQKFDKVFENFKKIRWDLLSADIIPDHFLEDSIPKERTKSSATYDCSAYINTDSNARQNEIIKALWEKMDKSAFFNEGEKGYFGTSHLYPWKNCFGLWFEFVGEPTNTGRPIIDAEIQTYTHNMCDSSRIIAYPDSIINTGIILSQYNTYNLDITVPLMNVAGYPFDYILRFGKPYPNIVSMLYRKLDSKINGSTIYDHIKELNDSSNYYYFKYPFFNNGSGEAESEKNQRLPESYNNIQNLRYDSLLYPADGYYGHVTAGNSYGKPQERLANNPYVIGISIDVNNENAYGTVNRIRMASSLYYNNYFGYTYKDCQKYTISSTDLVNVRDETGQSTSSITGGRTLWENINMELQLIANISFLNSSSYNQHIGLYVSKDTTDNNYGIPIENIEPPEIESPPTTGEIESSGNIAPDALPPINETYTQGINWAMPPKFQDYFSENNKKDIYELFTGDKLKWYSGVNERYLDKDVYKDKLHINNITLIPHYLGYQHASNLGDKFILDLYYLTVQEKNDSDISEHTFLVSRINYKEDKTYGTKRRWINFPANILGQIFDNDQNIVRLYGKNGKLNDIIINNSGIWQERYDLFCYFNHYIATLNKAKYVFDFHGNNFNILGELMVKPINKEGVESTDYKECTANNYNVQNKNYKLILPTVDIKEPEGTVEDSAIDVAAKYKKYYRTYNHYLGISENTTDTDGTSNEVYSYASKNTLFLRLKEYDNDDCALAHIDKYDALKEGQKLVPGFTAEAPRDKRPFSNRDCGWDVESQ